MSNCDTFFANLYQVCGGEQSLSSDFVWFYALKSDCHGYPIFDRQNYERLDECGVCGGNGDLCKDCLGNIDGCKIKMKCLLIYQNNMKW